MKIVDGYNYEKSKLITVVPKDDFNLLIFALSKEQVINAYLRVHVNHKIIFLIFLAISSLLF